MIKDIDLNIHSVSLKIVQHMGLYPQQTRTNPPEKQLNKLKVTATALKYYSLKRKKNLQKVHQAFRPVRCSFFESFTTIIFGWTEATSTFKYHRRETNHTKIPNNTNDTVLILV